MWYFVKISKSLPPKCSWCRSLSLHLRPAIGCLRTVRSRYRPETVVLRILRSHILEWSTCTVVLPVETRELRMSILCRVLCCQLADVILYMTWSTLSCHDYGNFGIFHTLKERLRWHQNFMFTSFILSFLERIETFP